MTTASRIPVYAERVDPGIAEMCLSGWSCQVAALFSDLWHLVMVGLAVVVILGTLLYLKSARENLEEEQSRTAAERQAFRDFADRIEELSPRSRTGANPTTDGGISAMATGASTGHSLDDVKDAYRETVMALPHYDEEYGDPLEKHMADEFGRDIATTVTTAREISPVLQQLLVSKARQSARLRASLMHALSVEEESIDEAEQTFDEVTSALTAFHPHELRDCDYSTLQNRWDELEMLEGETADVLKARQQTIRKHTIGAVRSGDGPTLCEYVYETMDVDFPILATGTKILHQIETSKATISRTVSRRH